MTGAPPTAAGIYDALDRRLVGDLRSDHAGETGAVEIYRGVLAIARDPELRRFATTHLAAEQRHLAYFDELLPRSGRSRLLPLWRMAGWCTGALPALLGPGAVYLTVDAVEGFVDRHYREQIDYLDSRGDHVGLRRELAGFREDEVHHREDACRRHRSRGPLAALWRHAVGIGSAVGVGLARRI